MKAMVYAAGKGERMMPLTANCPKPMLSVRGQPLLGHALDKLVAAGVSEAVINTHHKPESIERYVATRKGIRLRLSPEPTKLETGGGTVNALGLLGSAPFIGLNADIIWDEVGEPALVRLQKAWQPARMDVLLLLTPRHTAWGLDRGIGDFTMDSAGRLKHQPGPDTSFVYAGAQITKPELYASYGAGEIFSNLRIFNTAEASGRLYGLVHEGPWYHFSTPAALDAFAGF